MIINTKGVELTEAQYIKKDGKFLFEIKELVEDGYSNQGNPKFKLLFTAKEIITKDGKPTLSEDVYNHTEFYSTDQNVLWKIKTLEVALKAPEVYDIMDFVGRFAIGDVKMEEYNGKTNARIKKWAYSKQNDNLPPIKEAIQNSDYGATSVPEIDIDEDEIPF